MLVRCCSAYTSAMPSVTLITDVDIFETEIKEFYVFIKYSKMFNEQKMQLRFKVIYNLREKSINIHKNFGGTQLVPDSKYNVKDRT